MDSFLEDMAITFLHPRTAIPLLIGLAVGFAVLAYALLNPMESSCEGPTNSNEPATGCAVIPVVGEY